ncbi:hypothetical protein MW887_008386 [Aspergillus wentii]|nr:hypothetical protein MW887_008386 [Aspergillus wentii]
MPNNSIGNVSSAVHPEGGLRAWSVVFGAWCAMIPSMGLLNSLGVLQAWISTHQLKDYSESEVGWIFGAYGFFLFLGGAQFGPILDTYGPEYVILPGSIGMVISLICFSFSHEYYQIFLSFSVLGVLLSMACMLLKTRLPPNKTRSASIDFTALGDIKYASATVAVFLTEFAIFIPITYIASYAVHVGMSETMSYAIIVFLNLGAIPGRFLPGLLSDRFGRFNIMTLTLFMCFALTLAIWLTADMISPDSLAAIICYAVMFGFWSGASISLAPVCISHVYETQDYGKRIGTS